MLGNNKSGVVPLRTLLALSLPAEDHPATLPSCEKFLTFKPLVLIARYLSIYEVVLVAILLHHIIQTAS